MRPLPAQPTPTDITEPPFGAVDRWWDRYMEPPVPKGDELIWLTVGIAVVVTIVIIVNQLWRMQEHDS